METSNLRQPLAVVFCDIAGTSHLMAREGDLVTSTVLHDFFEHSGRLSKEHDCTFIKFIGDWLSRHVRERRRWFALCAFDSGPVAHALGSGNWHSATARQCRRSRPKPLSSSISSKRP